MTFVMIRVEVRPVFDRGPRPTTTKGWSEDHYRGPGRRVRAAPGWYVFSCGSDTSGRRNRAGCLPGPERGRSGHPEGGRSAASAAQAETLDDRAVALDVGLVQVVQQPTTLTHEEQQTTTRVVVVLVLLEVIGQVADAVTEQRDLHLGRTGVALLRGVLRDDLLLG